MSRTKVKCQVSSATRTTRQTAISRLQTPSRCHSCPNPQFVSVLGYECLGSTENIGQHGPSRVLPSAPFLSLNMPARLVRRLGARRRRFYTASSQYGEEHVTTSKTPASPVQLCPPSIILQALSVSAISQVVAEHAYRRASAGETSYSRRLTGR
jgi:hypothetical protein